MAENVLINHKLILFSQPCIFIIVVKNAYFYPLNNF